MTHTVVTALVFLSVASFHTQPPDAVTESDKRAVMHALENQISRDSEMLSKPMSITNSRKARVKLKEGIGELQFVISKLAKGKGSKAKWAHGELNRALAEEKEQASIPRTADRYRRILKNTIRKNLAVKKGVLKAMQDGLIW